MAASPWDSRSESARETAWRLDRASLLAQVIALVARGNWFLSKDGGVSLPDLQQTNSTFQYTSSVVFARYQDREQQQGEIIAGSVSEWFLLLKSVGVRRLWNIAFAWQNSGLQEYEAAAFAGGVPRAIQADLPHGFELWYPRWGTGGATQKPWTVEYRSLPFPHSHAPPLADLEGIKNQREFADKNLEAEYRKRTEQLYAAVKLATVMAPNSFYEAG